MPSSIFLSFDAPDGVPATPRRLHAALASVLDLPPGVSPERARASRTWRAARRTGLGCRSPIRWES